MIEGKRLQRMPGPGHERQRRWPGPLLALGGILLLPMPLAVAPVAMPLGSAYVTGGEAPSLSTLVLENWAYFFWYNAVGWSFLWFTINRWLGKLLRAEMPLRATLIPTAFCLAFYLALAGIVFPFPMGTYVGGAPCFLVLFACVYRELPKHADRGLALRAFAFFLGWVTLLFVLSLHTALTFRSEGDGAMQMVLGGAFILMQWGAEKCFALFIDNDVQRVDETLGLLWWLWISVTLETFFNFIFCDPNEPLWWAATLKIGSEAVASWQLWAVVHSARRWSVGTGAPSKGDSRRSRTTVRRSRTRGSLYLNTMLLYQQTYLGVEFVEPGEEVEYLEGAVVEAVVAVASPLHFGALLAWDHFSFNHNMFFLLDQLSTEDVLHMLRFLAANAGLSAIIAVLKVSFVRAKLDEGQLKRLELFVRNVLRRHYLDVVLLFASVTTVAGVCMVMKHDGMDSSFKFEWL